MIHKAIRMLADEDYSRDLFEAEKDSGQRALKDKAWAELQAVSIPEAVRDDRAPSDR